jgi:hypothetical protein
MEYQKRVYRNERPPDPKQPDYGERPPTKIDSTGYKKGGIYYVAGVGPKPAQIMFIAPSLLEEEAATKAESVTGRTITQDGAYLRGQAGAVFKDLASSVGIEMQECYFTAWCKWLLPKNNRSNPTNEQMDWGRQALMREIQEVKPAIIVCLGGKKIFDELSGITVKAKDVRGGWFLHHDSGAKVYLMENMALPLIKPEYLEKFRVDLRSICRLSMSLSGIDVYTQPTNYITINNSNEMQKLVAMWASKNIRLFSVDCEWHGSNHVNGQLRSIQFCWAPGEAVYIRFMDDALNYVFDVDYQKAGMLLGSWLNRPECKYIGHHFPADAPWMYSWLGLDWYNKCVFDTEFAQQTADEYEELGLERLAMKYTDLGRYDIELTLWKKQSKGLSSGGYGRVPDEILIPYACRDVDTVMRAYPYIYDNLRKQGLLDYYHEIFLPFTSNIFTTFSLLGLPIDIEQMSELRELYSFARQNLEVALRIAMHEEAKSLLLREMFLIKGNLTGPQTVELLELHKEVIGQIATGDDVDDPWMLVKRYVGVSGVARIKPFFDHLVASPSFNLRSKPQMMRWLFEVKGYMPIKSTNKKEKGLPSVSWDRVIRMPPEARKEYSPSTDIQTLEILYETHNDSVLGYLIRLNAVGNITKQFLKEPITDDEGNITQERGLHESLCSDGCVHGQMSTTETGRPRSWNPNILNWPSWVNDKITEGIQIALKQADAIGTLPEAFRKYLETKPPSIRSCVKAPDGWCFVESDYQTAEIRGLAFISGDENLIRIMTEPDQQYRKIKTENGQAKFVRVLFDNLLGISEELYGHLLSPDADFDVDAEGNYISPQADLHWSLAEMVTHKPREILNKDVERKGLGKVGNFSSAYGASPTTLERKIEQDTGVKPEEGTGQAVLDALRLRQPVAVAFLEHMENVPAEVGHYRSPSGRIRHCPMATAVGRDAKNYLASLGREMRNFPMQNNVADTAARAANWLLDYFVANAMQARPLIVLYDSVVTLCPISEAQKVAEMHQIFMCDMNTWTVENRTFNYPIDTDYVKRWSTKPNAEERLELDSVLS